MDVVSSLILASLLISAVILRQIWISDDSRAMKWALTVLVLVPGIGPIAYIWIGNWPAPNPPHLKSSYRGQQLGAELDRLYQGERTKIAEDRDSTIEKDVATSDMEPKQSLISRFRKPSRIIYFLVLLVGAFLIARYSLEAVSFFGAGSATFTESARMDSRTIARTALLAGFTALYFRYAFKNWPKSSES